MSSSVISMPNPEIKKIFDCVDNDDVEGLKLLMDYPNIFQIEDDSGLTILQKAISELKIAVFDFLLSLDGCPINARNSKGKTALKIAFEVHDDSCEHFIYSLVRNGANIDYDYEGSLLLHFALLFNYLELAKLLIEKGANLNFQDDYNGRTPLHNLFNSRNYDLTIDDLNEMLAMMLYFGADPSIPNDENHTAIDFVFSSHRLSESVLENLVFYYFDDYCTGYDIQVDNLFGLLQSDYSFTPQVLKHITSVSFDNISHYSIMDMDTYHFDELFIIKPEYLKLLLEKFDYVIENIVDSPHDDNIMEYVYWEGVFIENFDLLFESQFGPDVIQIIIDKTRISRVIYSAQNLKPQSKLLELIMVLLSYGANINDLDLEYIYEMFGDGEFFRILLHMDIEISDENEQCDIMPALLYNINVDIETFLSNPRKFKCSSRALEELFSYFANPKLKSYCCSESKDIYEKVKNLPSVPHLVELARNELRKFLIQKHKIKNCTQFYTLIKHLPISKVHEKIITLEVKLY